MSHTHLVVLQLCGVVSLKPFLDGPILEGACHPAGHLDFAQRLRLGDQLDHTWTTTAKRCSRNVHFLADVLQLNIMCNSFQLETDCACPSFEASFNDVRLLVRVQVLIIIIILLWQVTMRLI